MASRYFIPSKLVTGGTDALSYRSIVTAICRWGVALHQWNKSQMDFSEIMKKGNAQSKLSSPYSDSERETGSQRHRSLISQVSGFNIRKRKSTPAVMPAGPGGYVIMTHRCRTCTWCSQLYTLPLPPPPFHFVKDLGVARGGVQIRLKVIL